MIFSSKTPRDLNHDPKPYVCTAPDFERYASPDDYEGRHSIIHDPSPEYDHVQHNEPNPVLTSLRKRLQYQRDVGKPSTAPIIAQTMLRYIEVFQQHGVMSASPEQLEHARRVLARLARINEQETTA